MVLCLGLFGCETYYAGGSGTVQYKLDDQIHLGWDDYYGSDTKANKNTAAQYCKSRDKFAYYFKDKSSGHNAAIYLCSASVLNVSPITGKSLVWTNFNPNSEMAKKNNISQAKSTCKDLGLAVGSDKYIDCTIKLSAAYIQTQQQTIVQASSSSSGSMTIYDPVRDSENAMRRGMALVNGTCTVANYLNC